MRSGNGRHRRPRQAPALVVAAGVTGSALALPLFAASGASAATASTWDSVAECESGGAWSADFGNGLYGGLQFSQETWQQYGGTAYAERADLASRAQQIAVAEKVLAAKGPKAFTSCSGISGLTAGGGAPAVDPGATPSPYVPSEEGAATPDTTATPSAPAKKPPASTTPSASSSAAPKPSMTPSGPSAPSTGASGKPGSTDAAEPAGTATGPAAGSASGGKHRGTPDPGETGTPATTEPGNTDNTHESGRHASRGDAGSRESGDVLAAEGDYTVRPGDNLWDISRSHKVEGGWSALYKANEKTIGADPNLILPGQNLDLNPTKTDNPAPVKG